MAIYSQSSETTMTGAYEWRRKQDSTASAVIIYIYIYICINNINGAYSVLRFVLLGLQLYIII